MKSPITTHVLDTTLGIAAQGVKVTLFELVNDIFVPLNTENTNQDGRCLALLHTLKSATYKLKFEIKEYYKKRGIDCFFPYCEVVFEVDMQREHYHVPLVVTPFAFSTYRGT